MTSPQFVIQGTLNIGTTTIYSPPDKKVATILYIKFYNPAAYDITLSRYDNATASNIDIYSLNLAAGDSITDSTTYLLNELDKLDVTTAVAGTSYLISLFSI